MNVLVTGGTGFVGRRLVERLARDSQHQVVATYRGERPSFPAGRTQWHRVSDIGPTTEWSPVLDDIDAVIHLAALNHQVGRQGEGKLREFLKVNAEGAAALALACRQSSRIRSFILVSSIHAVGSASETALDERMACQPNTDYGRSKLQGELLVIAAFAGSQIACSILRPPLIYGPGNPGNMARLIDLLAKRRPLPVGAIHNRRSLIYVDNFVDALVTCLMHPAPRTETYFVTDGTELSTAGLSGILAKHMQVPVRLWHVAPSLLRLAGNCGDAVERVLHRSIGIDSYSVNRLTGSLWADGSKFKATFNWSPPFGLEEGFRSTCAESASKSTQQIPA